MPPWPEGLMRSTLPAHSLTPAQGLRFQSCLRHGRELPVSLNKDTKVIKISCQVNKVLFDIVPVLDNKLFSCMTMLGGRLHNHLNNKNNIRFYTS